MARFSLLAMWFAALVGLTLRSAVAEPPIEKAQAKAARVDSTAETPEEAKFIRVRRDDEDRPVAMETAVVHYTSKTRPGISIDLVGAVHIADRSYYDELNKLFEKYDVV